MTRLFSSRSLFVIGWLTVLWVALWGELTGPNVVTGVLVGSVIVWWFPVWDSRDAPLVMRPVATLSLLVWFTWALIQTNLTVAREVLVPPSKSKIRPGIVAVHLTTRSGRLATIIANAITLTPGTMTVDVRGRPATLFIHVLSFESVEAVVAEVEDLERRVVAAFGTAEERALICSPSKEVPA